MRMKRYFLFKLLFEDLKKVFNFFQFFQFFFQVLESSSEEEEDEDPALEAMRAQLAKDTSMVRKLKRFNLKHFLRMG